MPRPPRAHQLTQKGKASRVSTEAQRSLPEHDTTLFTSLKVKPAAVFHLILLSKRKPLWFLSFEATLDDDVVIEGAVLMSAFGVSVGAISQVTTRVPQRARNLVPRLTKRVKSS